MFAAIPELHDSFLELFPHRQDYLYSPHSDHGHKPQWKSEDRHPLTDRLIRQCSYLYGVRFGKLTEYCLIDIDRGSPYHPAKDRNAVHRIMGLLEELGINAWMACTSSYSGGIHIYCPLSDAVASWQIALALQTLLENGGYAIKPGHLEIFPNVREYSPENPKLFNGHRLPLQIGSYLIPNAIRNDWEPQSSSPAVFVSQWKFCKSKNLIEDRAIATILKQARRQRFKVSGKANKFLNDLNAEIELGWTGSGQTNRLLGRIAMRAYIFGHLLIGSTSFISGDQLVDAIVDVAVSLPGYEDFCNHRHEIRDRAQEWADSVENSKYFPYRSKRPEPASDLGSVEPNEAKIHPNELRSIDARERIARAIAELLDRGELAIGARARFLQLVAAGIGGGTLYKHRDLWHPASLWITPPEPPPCFAVDRSELAEGYSEASSLPSLLADIASNTPSAKDSSDFVSSYLEETASNMLPRPVLRRSKPESEPQQTKDPSIDYGADIAKIQAYLQCLEQFDPKGEWTADPLLAKWGEFHYSLTGSQLEALGNYLQAYYHDLQRSRHMDKVDQLGLFTGESDQ